MQFPYIIQCGEFSMELYKKKNANDTVLQNYKVLKIAFRTRVPCEYREKIMAHAFKENQRQLFCRGRLFTWMLAVHCGTCHTECSDVVHVTRLSHVLFHQPYAHLVSPSLAQSCELFQGSQQAMSFKKLLHLAQQKLSNSTRQVARY